MTSMEDSHRFSKLEGVGHGFKERLEAFNAKVQWCPKCGYPMRDGECGECLNIARARAQAQADEKAATIRRLGGIRAYEDYTEEKFDSKYYDAKKAIALCSNFPHDNIYVWGDRGVGKTHLGVACIRKHPKGMLLKPYDVLRELRSLVLNVDAEKNALDRLIAHPCLLLDDLGTEKLTEHALSLIYEIIDARYMNKRTGLMITSNYGLDDLSAKMGDDRVASRLSGMCKIIRLTGQDRRPEQNR